MNKLLLNTINNLNYPENIHKIHYIKPKQIPLDLIARIKCMNCGLY